ncbi:MAG: hypothetical protein GX456_09900 [Verrucomicrobia bacterium]|nr:hypothetical protein [Verrucomicrobiota bacterium]
MLIFRPKDATILLNGKGTKLCPDTGSPGARPSPAAFNPTTDPTPVSITQIRRPIFDRLGAGKNGRAPTRAGKSNRAGSAAVPGRIQPDDRSHTCFNHPNAPPEP